MTAQNLLNEINRIDNTLTDVLATADKKKIGKKAVELHGKLRTAKRDFDAIDSTDPQREEARLQLVAVTKRLMCEGFGMESS